jgi:PAS domain-containing protein
MKSQKNSSPPESHYEPSEFNFTKLGTRFALIYWIFAISWIFFSDQVVFALWKNSDLLNAVQTYKGLFFVSVTSMIFYFALSGRIPLTAINLYQKAKNAETARSEIEKKLNGLSRSNLIGFFMGQVDGPILEANQEFLRMVGYSERKRGAIIVVI